MYATLATAIVQTPKGSTARYFVRPDCSDGALVGGIVEEDEYKLADLPSLSGWAIDIGAHIGTVAIALAVDHPDLRVVAIEALPENCEVLRANVQMNGLHDQVTVLEMAATNDTQREVPITYGWTWAVNQPDHYMHDSRFIGDMVEGNDSSTTLVCPGIGLARIFKMYGIDRAALLKIDCEGCEWQVLTSPLVGRIDRILGEFHDEPFMAGVHDLLDATHDVRHLSGVNVGHFDATLR